MTVTKLETSVQFHNKVCGELWREYFEYSGKLYLVIARPNSIVRHEKDTCIYNSFRDWVCLVQIRQGKFKGKLGNSPWNVGNLWSVSILIPSLHNTCHNGKDSNSWSSNFKRVHIPKWQWSTNVWRTCSEWKIEWIVGSTCCYLSVDISPE